MSADHESRAAALIAVLESLGFAMPTDKEMERIDLMEAAQMQGLRVSVAARERCHAIVGAWEFWFIHGVGLRIAHRFGVPFPRSVQLIAESLVISAWDVVPEPEWCGNGLRDWSGNAVPCRYTKE